MMKRKIIFMLMMLWQTSKAQTMAYKLEMPDPHKHYYYVTMTIEGWKKNTLDVKMPVWAPGSYLVREFAKGVDYVKATGDGANLKVAKTDKSTWRIQTDGKSKIVINYNVYAYELSVRTSFLDSDHGFITGTSVFMYVPELKVSPGTLDIILPAQFKKISTVLPLNGQNSYSYSSIDELYDCPIEIGNHIEFEFMSSGCKHRVAMFGEGNYDVEKLKLDMPKITDECTKVWGENPNKEYLFIIHNLTVGSGGLEHANSTCLQVNRNTYTGGNYVSFLSLVAHEYFHLWNVKRLRPAGLWPYDYDKENYTDLLWISEGFTSYYDELLLKRAGYTDESSYLRTLNSTLGSVENQPGSHVQSLAESSHDAWIKGYRPNENSNNRTISYYPKGALTGALLDIEIISSTNGKYKLDDLLRKLYTDFFKAKKQGFTFADFKQYAENICGKKLDQFFEDLVLTANHFDYNNWFKLVGCNLSVNNRSNTEPWLGAGLKDVAGKCTVSSVTDNSCAFKAGLNVNDEIIAINNQRVDNSNTINTALKSFGVGATVEFLVSRDNVLRKLTITLEKSILKDFNLSADPGAVEQAKKNREKWLN